MRLTHVLLWTVPALLAVTGLSAAEPNSAAEQAWIGVWLGDADDGGVEVIALVPGGPGMVADLRPGDIILKANGRAVNDQLSLKQALETTSPGDEFRVELLRSGTALEARIEVGLRGHSSTPTARELFSRSDRRSVKPRQFGLRVTEVTPGLRRHFGAPEDAGVLVVRCEPEQLAARAGIQVGDIVVSVGKRRIVTPRQIDSSLRAWPGTLPIEVQLVREHEPRVVIIDALDAHEGDDRGEDDALLQQRLSSQIQRLEEKLARLKRDLARLQEAR